MAQLTISFFSQLVVKTVLIIGGSGVKQVLEIGEVTRTRWMYKPKYRLMLKKGKEMEKMYWLRKRKGRSKLVKRTSKNALELTKGANTQLLNN